MKMNSKLKSAYQVERTAARNTSGAVSFSHLERAHILGQKNVWAHTSTHLAMLVFGWKQKNFKEVFGQIVRSIAALTKTLIWVPEGNTGGSNVNPFKPMPIPTDLKKYFTNNNS